jgi:hypothetical protein
MYLMKHTLCRTILADQQYIHANLFVAGMYLMERTSTESYTIPRYL